MPRAVTYLAATVLLVVSGLRLKGCKGWQMDTGVWVSLGVWFAAHLLVLKIYPREIPGWAVLAVCAAVLIVCLSKSLAHGSARVVGLLGSTAYATVILLMQLLADCGAELPMAEGFAVSSLAAVVYAIGISCAGLVRRCCR